MKTIAVSLALVAVAFAAPQYPQQKKVIVVKQTLPNKVDHDGYKYAYELSNGQKHDESAQFEAARANPEQSVFRVRGSYSSVGPDGQTYTVNYIADENGFQPQGTGYGYSFTR